MKHFTYKEALLTGGYLQDKETLNRKITIDAVYNRFYDTGRITAFNFDSKDVHIFWDSDVAKWMEGAAYILGIHPDKELEEKVESLIDCIEKNQCEDGYFNIYYTVVEPQARFSNRDCHELYCAGHLFEAAVAYAEATGKERFLHLMEKYADHIYRVFVEERSAKFMTPGHQEIELALVKMYRYTGKKKYLDLSAHFINTRGHNESDGLNAYNQSHLPVRNQTTAEGHAVRAMYMYAAMADLAYELGDKQLLSACEALYDDVVNTKMYITGGIGSCHLGETFANPYDMPNEEAYNETCAGIGLMFFCQRMLKLQNKATYADTIERVFYNGVLSGISLDGKSFFYENPLEITMANHFKNDFGERRFPITQRLECFGCSCCPPNINRLFAVLSEYIYGLDGDTLFINQFADSTLKSGSIEATMHTNYPRDGKITINAKGVQKIAVRIPSWCDSFTINAEYTTKDGYAIICNCDSDVVVDFDMTPFAVRSRAAVVKDVGKLCIQAGPIVYCAESIDNCNTGENLHAVTISHDFTSKVSYDESIGLNVLDISAYRYVDSDKLYSRAKDRDLKPITLRMIPYSAFANRGECDFLTWFNEKL